MNHLVMYTGAIASIIVISFAFFHFKEHLTLKSILFFFVGVIFIGLCSIVCIEGEKINDRLKIEDIPNEIISTIGYESDSLINDTIVYDYLIEIRAKHPRVILAQCKLESCNYTSDIFLKNKNLVGMKTSSRRTSFNSGSKGGYQRYDTWRQCLNDYVLWGMTHGYDKMSQDEYITYLNKIYAEDNSYAIKLNKIISKTNFNSFD